jgi:site-specific DNA recombinase
LVSCEKCGYGLYRTSTRSSARKIHYYRCLESDRYRHFIEPACDNRPVRQDLLDDVVWAEIMRLMEDRQIIQAELDRRLQAAQQADPTKRRQDDLRRDCLRLQKAIERLLTAYQENLVSLDELRQRMPDLRAHQRTAEAELQAISDQIVEGTNSLRLAETISDFLTRLRSSGELLTVNDRQRVVRLLVKDIIVGDDKIVIRHSIPLPGAPPPDGPSNPSGTTPKTGEHTGYLLRSRSNQPDPRQPVPALRIRSLDAAGLPGPPMVSVCG